MHVESWADLVLIKLSLKAFPGMVRPICTDQVGQILFPNLRHLSMHFCLLVTISNLRFFITYLHLASPSKQRKLSSCFNAFTS